MGINHDSQKVYELTLNNILTTSVSEYGQTKQAPSLNVVFNFSEIGLVTTSHTADGRIIGQQIYDWDVVLNRAPETTLVEPTPSVPVSGPTPDNRAPVISSDGGDVTATVSVMENQTTVTHVTATDPDAVTALTYTIVGGVDASAFNIDKTSGLLTFEGAPDFETPADDGGDNIYQVIVQSSDGALSDRQTLYVNVSNVAGASITGTENRDFIDSKRTVAGQPLSTGEEDVIVGMDGNDVLHGGAGADTLDGGAGDDMVDYNGSASGVTVDLHIDTLGFQSATGGDADGDVLSGFEHVRGSDFGDVLIGNDDRNVLIGNKGSDNLSGDGGDDVLFGETYRIGAFSPDEANLVFRLYKATLDRAPDAHGHLAWTGRLVDGDLNRSEVSSAFVRSDEFLATYGALEDSDFVALLYNNILGRDPDEAGRIRWEGDLANLMPRGDVVLGLSESDEFKITTNAAASTFGDSGSWGDEVYRLYGATLDRAPNVEGFHNWSDRLAAGVDFKTVVTGFVESEEFQTKYGELDNTAFITQLYRNVLTREPEDEGLANSVQRLVDGTTTRVEAVLGFSESAEYKILTANDMKSWIRDLGYDDILNGGAGENTLVGGIGADLFVFDQSDSGTNTVLDLEAWDYLEFRGFAYDVPVNALDFMQQTDANVVFADQGVNITFTDVDLSTLTEDMFL
jgi:Ca2+-binding RTX toxin-like protein